MAPALSNRCIFSVDHPARDRQSVLGTATAAACRRTFFVPERARWSYLRSKLNDTSKPFGSRLDEALAALTESNDSLTHVLDHI